MTTRTLEVMKQNPVKSAVTMIGSIAAVVIFFWTVEDRYVSAADFQQYQRQQQHLFTDFRRQQLEDELFELQLKAEKNIITDVERAKLFRIQRQLQKLNR